MPDPLFEAHDVIGSMVESMAYIATRVLLLGMRKKLFGAVEVSLKDAAIISNAFIDRVAVRTLGGMIGSLESPVSIQVDFREVIEREADAAAEARRADLVSLVNSAEIIAKTQRGRTTKRPTLAQIKLAYGKFA